MADDYSFISEGAINPQQALKDIYAARSARETLNTQRIANESNQKVLNEQNHIRKLAENGYQEFMGPDGSLDLNKFAPEVLKGAPTIGGQHIAELYHANQANTEAKKALNSLDAQKREYVANAVMSTSGETPEQTYQALEERFSANPQLKPVWEAAKGRFQTVQGNPQAFEQLRQQFAKSILSVGEQNTLNAPQGPILNNGQQQTMLNTNGLATDNNGMPIAKGAAVLNVQNQLSPSEQFTMGVDSQNQPIVTERLPSGQPAGISTIPVQGAAPQAPQFISPQQQQQLQEAQKEVEGVRQSGDNVPNDAYLNKQVLNLLQSDKTSTGPIAAAWQKVSGGLFGDNYQEAAKYLEQNALSKMKAMGGGGSDARLQAALAANGNAKEYNPGPLIEITKYNDAANTALGMYREGIDKAVGLKNSNYSALPEFKSVWAKNLDPNVFRAINAQRDGDTMELAKLRHELGEEKFKQLGQKYANLKSLAETGRLP